MCRNESPNKINVQFHSNNKNEQRSSYLIFSIIIPIPFGHRFVLGKNRLQYIHSTMAAAIIIYRISINGDDEDPFQCTNQLQIGAVKQFAHE